MTVGPTELTAFTDDTGTYRFDKVPPVTGALTYRLINFTLLRRHVGIDGGHSITSDAVLSLSLSADIVVTGTLRDQCRRRSRAGTQPPAWLARRFRAVRMSVAGSRHACYKGCGREWDPS